MEFGIESSEGIYERNFIGKYVIIYPQGRHDSFSGKINSIEEGVAVLNPFLGSIYSENGFMRKLLYQNAIVNIMGAHVEKKTKKSLENLCKIVNDGKKESED